MREVSLPLQSWHSCPRSTMPLHCCNRKASLSNSGCRRCMAMEIASVAATASASPSDGCCGRGNRGLTKTPCCWLGSRNTQPKYGAPGFHRWSAWGTGLQWSSSLSTTSESGSCPSLASGDCRSPDDDCRNGRGGVLVHIRGRDHNCTSDCVNRRGD